MDPSEGTGEVAGETAPHLSSEQAKSEPAEGDLTASGQSHLASFRAQLRSLEHAIGRGAHVAEGIQERFLIPAWRRVTQAEPRWPVSLAILAALALQIILPEQVAVHPRWVIAGVEAALMVGLIAVNPVRIDRRSKPVRTVSMILIAIITGANGWSAVKLVVGLVRGTYDVGASQLLVSGAAIWLTNVIAFSLWYWELDRGGPAARAHGISPHPDFLFAQIENPDLASDQWEPGFADYLYISFTNATAFSPTDVPPLTRWAKMTMMLQSAVSLTTVGLVIARAVNILK